MSLPNEKAWSLRRTQELLYDLCDRTYHPGWTELRLRASSCLKHFPFSHDIEEAQRAWERRIR